MSAAGQREMISYASNTGTRINLEQFRRYGWRILLTPLNPKLREGLRFAVDNGAWSCSQQGLPFDDDGFRSLVEAHGAGADFVVIPDIVAGGMRSLEFSLSWMDRLKGLKRLLLPLQDGMTAEDIGAVLRQYPDMGLFLGGSTDWKLSTMGEWGAVAHAFGRYYHVGRVNSRKRIRMCQHAGADSVDGTSGTLFSVTVPRLDGEIRQASLLSPRFVQ
jgi:hypothetical protein